MIVLTRVEAEEEEGDKEKSGGGGAGLGKSPALGYVGLGRVFRPSSPHRVYEASENVLCL